MGYIFYDTETTGLTAGFDQILQFAALVTDDNLNVVEEVDLRCRLQPHVLPSPGALAITGMRPSTIASAPLSHYQMIQRIRSLIEHHSPAIMVGFNTLGYDEGMLRQAFYQTLNPIYLTNTGGNARMDMLRVAHAVAQYAPNVLVVPSNAEGRPSFKLGLLSAANGLLHDHAHDALSDTWATLELAKLIRSKAPMVWQAMLRTRSKQTAMDMLYGNELFLFTDMAFGTPTILASSIAANTNNPTEVAVFDLAHDPEPALELDVDGVLGMLKALPRLIRVVRLNNQPILMEPDRFPVGWTGCDLETARYRANRIARHPTFGKVVGQALASRYPDREPSEYVEQRIYEGFPSRADAAVTAKFHTVPWAERAELVARLSDKRLRELGERLIYLEHPEVLAADVRHRYDDWRRERLTANQAVPWVTLASGRQELEQMRGENLDEMLGLIVETEEYFDQIARTLEE